MPDKMENEKSPYRIGEQVQDVFQTLKNNVAVKAGLKCIKDNHPNTVDEMKKIVAIPAPTFKEQQRGEYFGKRLIELGLKDVQVDSVGNVYAIRSGNGSGPTILIDAHLDTVFEEDVDLIPVEKDGKIFAPGIGDDVAGLANMLAVLQALQAAGIETAGDIVFLGSVCHEGTGDLRGIKTFLNNHSEIAAAIHLEPVNGIIYSATGSRRYEVVYTGPGGHSWIGFGLPNAIHAIGRAIAQIADVSVPQAPKTTFNIGIVNGGTSVNTIAPHASLLLDMRSVSEEELLKLEDSILPIFQQAATEENARWGSENGISVEIKKIGDRPAGAQPIDSIIVQSAAMAMSVLGGEPRFAGPMSTNGNYTIKLGIPMVVFGSVDETGDTHAKSEWIIPNHKKVQELFLMTLGLAGALGISKPIIKK